MKEEIVKLAKHIVNYSCKVNHGDLVYVNVVGNLCELVEAVVNEIYLLGAYPYIHIFPNDLVRILLSSGSENFLIDNLKKLSNLDNYVTAQADCYIEILNDVMLSDLHLENLNIYKKYYYNPTQWHCREQQGEATRWITVRNPSDIIYSHADLTVEKSIEWIWKLYSFDYKKLSLKMKSLQSLMERTRNVRIVATDTDIEFSIEHQPVIICDGNINIPDGEIFVSPIKNSINGNVLFNVPFWYMGESFQYIKLKVKEGKVVEFETDNMNGLTKLLSLDNGAKYFGEFAIGTNPCVDKFIGNTLFDEKMLGTIHFALGNCIGASPNNNFSCIHMDLIVDIRERGEIYFDNVKIFENGRFISSILKGLNYDEY